MPSVKLKGPAIKIGLTLSWQKSRQQKRFFRIVEVKFTSEEKERQQQRAALCGEEQIERRPLSFYSKAEETVQFRQTPATFIWDIPKFMKNLLREHKSQGKLIGMTGLFPLMKCGLCLGEGGHPEGTHLSWCFRYPTSETRTPGTTPTCWQWLSVSTHLTTWEGSCRSTRTKQKQSKPSIRVKRVWMFLFGDYDFLLKLFGLSGAQLVHSCLNCLASKAPIQTPPIFNHGNITKHNMAQTETDYDKFRISSKQKTRTKLFNNPIRKSLSEVELDHVAPPYLHFLLCTIKICHDLIFLTNT